MATPSIYIYIYIETVENKHKNNLAELFLISEFIFIASRGYFQKKILKRFLG